MTLADERPLEAILRARVVVGYLGERARFGWWPTAFFNASSRPFLEPVFPKTLRVAQYHGVVEAARRLHDDHLNVGTYHLFRLPEEMEQDLHLLMHGDADALPLAELCSDKETALDALNGFAGSAQKSGSGPVSMGSVSNIGAGLSDIASVYRSAFTSGTQSFPYLSR